MRKINKTYKFRLYRNRQQAEMLERHFGCARFVYNFFLNQRIEQYKKTKTSTKYYEQAKVLTILKKQEGTAWLKEVNSQTLQFALRCLDTAYKNFFQKRSKLPHFKSKRSKNSFTVPQHAHIADNRLFLTKFKEGIKVQNVTHTTTEMSMLQSISFEKVLKPYRQGLSITRMEGM